MQDHLRSPQPSKTSAPAEVGSLPSTARQPLLMLAGVPERSAGTTELCGVLKGAVAPSAGAGLGAGLLGAGLCWV